MILLPLATSPPLDDFLAGAGSETATGELLERIGLIGSLTGITLATGLIVFLVAVHCGSKSEVQLLLKVAAGAGVLTVAGAAIQIAGAASVLDTSWFDAISSPAGSAAMIRLLAGVLIALGLYADVVPSESPEPGPPEAFTVDRPVGILTEPLPEPPSAADPAPDEDRSVRWVASAASAFGLGGIVAGVLSFGFDGHTVTEGPRAVHMLVNFVHVMAGSVWLGGLVALAVLSYLRRRSGGSVAALAVRFSGVATVALVAVALAGVLMSLMITDGFGDYTGTDWGRLLILKTAIVGVVAAIGGYNHFVVVPRLERDPDDPTLLARARLTVSTEALLLLIVAVTTVFLTTSSTN